MNENKILNPYTETATKAVNLPEDERAEIARKRARTDEEREVITRRQKTREAEDLLARLERGDHETKERHNG